MQFFLPNTLMLSKTLLQMEKNLLMKFHNQSLVVVQMNYCKEEHLSKYYLLKFLLPI